MGYNRHITQINTLTDLAGEDLDGTLAQLRTSAQAIHHASQEIINRVESESYSTAQLVAAA